MARIASARDNTSANGFTQDQVRDLQVAKKVGDRDATWGVCRTEPTSSTVSGEKYVWQPSRRLGDDVPRGNPAFGVELRCQILSDGTRLFLPTPSSSTFIANAQAAGLAILIHQRKLGSESRNSHRFDWFLYQHARRMQPFMRRRFHSRSDLLVRRSGQSTKGERDILPWEKSKSGSIGTRLPATLDELMELGAERASQEGVERPTAKQRIQFGLIVAAERMPPLSPSNKGIVAIIRTALFDVRSEVFVPQKKRLAVIRDRLARALGSHLDDATMELFNAWLWGPKSNVVKQIAKQKKAPGGELDREEVSQAIVELGWQAHASVAKSVEALMIDFRRAIHPQLSRKETRIFNQLYQCQEHFGGLSLIMLRERLEFIGSHLWQLIEKPGKHQLAILYRLLSFYSSMLDQRRAADKRSKQRLHASVRTSPYNENSKPEKPQMSDISDRRLAEIAEKVCEAQGIRCSCEKPDWKMDDIHVFIQGKVTASVRCRNKGCRFSTSVEFSAADYRGRISPE